MNEYLGEHCILTLNSGAAQFRAMVPPSVTAMPGAPFTLRYRLKDVMVFDAETEAFVA